MSLKLYFDLLSQPSRALYIYLKAAKVPFEPCMVPLAKNAQLKPEYAKINRFQKVPCIDDNGFKLAESVAIFRYLARTYPKEDHWYPKDSKSQASVDEFLEWQHTALRMPCGMYFVNKWLLPFKTGKETPVEKINESKMQMDQALDLFEKHWLKDRPYMAGEKISIADIVGACEVEQPKIAGFDPAEGRPLFKEWLERVRKDLNPHYDEAHKFVYKLFNDQKQ
ncbi:glutathione S-transferase theta-1-like isoform X1 [Ctenocephalides felis]|uniref:glutathione S-transferase theta-1-like isoform X1 n=1 Tax=Ctenocephalides felis TaxID=7515 RepID=UPI000E6E2CAB|nr:glutathione S-transferase theta-1-like isoform X1 [Ctenocephalides felis]